MAVFYVLLRKVHQNSIKSTQFYAIASVLGVAVLSNVSDLNDLNKAGVYRLNDTSLKSNVPSGINDSCVCVVYTTGDYKLQVLYGLYSNQMFKRTRYNSWGAWQQVYDTSLLTNSDLLSPLASALGETCGFKYTVFTLQAQESFTLPAYYGIYMIRNTYSTDGIIIYPKYSDNNIAVMSDPNSELNNRFTLTKPSAGAVTIKNITGNDLGFQITIFCASAM